MNRFLFIVALAILSAPVAGAGELYVAPQGDDTNDGSRAKPFRTISAAAAVAAPGDVVTVHQGVYRERVTPMRGGESADKRIVYQAAPGERVEIKGSEIVRGWKPIAPDAWQVVLPNSFFGKYNPYQDLIAGDWFNPLKRTHHTGEIYLNGKSLWEVSTPEEVLHPRPFPGASDSEGSTYTWHCQSDAENTTLTANFHGHEPNAETVEINARESCFYPGRTGCNYLTVRGFRMSQAATQWAAPTAEQIGLIGTFWSKGWIIENNVVSDSKCSGITLGKDRLSGHNVWTAHREKDGATHYNEVIVRALENGWSKEKIGSHVVRNNEISNCGQTGICGSMGGAFSEISGNDIHDIYTKRTFTGAEMGGIKLHGAVDVLIKNNRLHNAYRGMWMDWMAQGTRITGNLCDDNSAEDLYVEVDHGPFVVDNNLFLSRRSLWDMSEGGAYAHNLFAGIIAWRADKQRLTPYLQPHATAIAGLRKITDTDNRFFNNVFIGAGSPTSSGGLDVYDKAEQAPQTGGNVYLHGARPSQSVYR